MRGQFKSQLELLLAAWATVVGAGFAHGATYYVHPARGNDTGPGTSTEAPFRTLDRASQIRLQSGDSLLLAAGESFQGQLVIDGASGTADRPIAISTYLPAGATGRARAGIDARGNNAGVLLRNSAHVHLANLSLTGDGGGMKQPQPVKPDMRCGLLVLTDRSGEYGGYSLSNIVIKDVFFEERGFTRAPHEVRSANGTQNYGWGIRLISTSPGAIMKDICIRDCRIENVSHTGLKFTAPSNGIQNVLVERVQVTHTGGPGVQMSGVRGGQFRHLDVNSSGSTNDSRNWKRGSGLWTWTTSDVVIEKSRFVNANGPGDSAGVHIDFNCRNVIVQHNFSANNAGGFCEILGNNYNCAYRYNVSVNDGHRVKGRNGAFQEGKIFWLSGYTGDHSPREGPFNSYFYNNTIYVSKELTAKFAVAPTAQGVLVANNIFYIQGPSEYVLGDQSVPDHGKAGRFQDVVFENNLYLRTDNWPSESPIQDRTPQVGNPEFRNAGGYLLEDYIPRNVGLVRHQGVPISRLSHDVVGLAVGLEVEADILGHRVTGQPAIGAIHVE